jgi:type II secretory pathway pseudopilin PulG
VLRILKNKKGMTLMELIVGSMMFAIIAITVTSVLSPMLRAYVRANDIAEYNTLLDSVANRIISDLSESIYPPIISGNNQVTIRKPHNVIYTVPASGDNAGILHRDGIPVFSGHYYKNKSVSFIVTQNTSAGVGVSYTLTVTIIRDSDGFPIPRNYTVRPLALNPHHP